MDNFEKVEKLVEKAGVSYEDAKAALEKAEGDLLDAMIILEKEGKAEAPKQSSYSTKYEEQAQYESVTKKVEEDRKSHTKEEQRRERKERFKAAMGKITHFLSSNFLQISRNGEKIAQLPLWAVAIILIVAWYACIIGVIVSLFFGVKYSLGGEADMSTANNVMDKASSAAEKVKEEFK